jgi:hypothetical protein
MIPVPAAAARNIKNVTEWKVNAVQALRRSRDPDSHSLQFCACRKTFFIGRN